MRPAGLLLKNDNQIEKMKKHIIITRRILNIVLPWLLLLQGNMADARGWQWIKYSTNSDVDGGGGLIATDPAGNVFVAGVNVIQSPTFFGTVTIPPDPDGLQTLLAKYDVSGNLLWTCSSVNGNSEPIAMSSDADGNLVLLGWFDSPTLQIGSVKITNTLFPGTQYFLLKLDPSGNILWAKNDGSICNGNYDINTFTKYLGQSAYGAVCTDKIGNIYVVASYMLPINTVGTTKLANKDVTGNSSDIFMVKYDPAGNILWAKSYGGDSADYACAMTITPAGDLYIAGVFKSTSINSGSTTITNTSNEEEAFIARFDKNGTAVWADHAGNGLSFASGLAPDESGNVYMAGTFTNSGISFSGTSIANPYINNYIPYLVKFNQSNQVEWYKTIGAPTGWTKGFGVAVGACDHVWLLGATFSVSVNIDGNTIVNNPLNSTDGAIFIAGYTTNGHLITYTSLPGAGDDQSSIVCDSKGNVYLGGDYVADLYYGKFFVNQDTLPVSKYMASYENLFVAKFAANDTLPDTVLLHSDTSACSAQKITLRAPPGYTNYLWYNKSTSDTNVVSGFGTYWVMSLAGSSCKESAMIDSFTVKPGKSSMIFSLGPDTATCDTVPLSAPFKEVQFLWQDGSTDSIYMATKPGTYYVTISKGVCVSSDTINITRPDISQHLSDTTVCKGEGAMVQLQANVPPGGTVLWNNGSTNAVNTVTDSGRYWVTVTNAGCTSSDSMTLQTELCDCWYFIPNAFTPNGDGKNDWFYPFIEPACIADDYKFFVFNRWGEVVFSSRQPGEGWDGIYKGVSADLGVYEYWFEFNGGTKHTKHFKKGDVTLVK